MASIIKSPDQDQGQQIDLLKADIGPKAAVIAATPSESPDPSWQDLQEEELLDVIQANNGSLVAKNQKGPVTDEEREKEGRMRVSEEDSLDEALKKRAQRAQEQSQEVGDEDLGVDLNEVDGLNDVSQAIRDYGNYSVVQGSPELFLVMGGLSESLDMLVASALPANQAETNLQDASNVIFLFQELNKKKSQAVGELEREAELMLGGAVAILAIPEIVEKLIQQGIDPEIAKSLEGPLAKIVNEASQKSSDLHSMYVMLKEETELSKRDEDEEAA